MSDLLDADQVRAMATPAGALWAGERAPTALALARTALAWRGKGGGFVGDAFLAIVERDEAYRQRDEARSDRDAERGLRLALESQIGDARAILGAAAGDLLSDAAERAACAVQHEANAMDIIGRAIGRKVIGGADVAAIHASEEIERLRGRVKDLVGAERERDRLLRSEADICKILGAAPDELLSDAARRAMSEPENVSGAANMLSEAFLIDDFGNDIEDLAKQAADQIDSVRGSLLVPADDAVAIHARDIRDSLAGEPGATVSERVALVMVELRRLRAAEAEPPQVFRPPISVTVRHACDHPFAEVVIGAIQDPAFLAIPMGARLGLVVLRD